MCRQYLIKERKKNLNKELETAVKSSPGLFLYIYFFNNKLLTFNNIIRVVLTLWNEYRQLKYYLSCISSLYIQYIWDINQELQFVPQIWVPFCCCCCFDKGLYCMKTVCGLLVLVFLYGYQRRPLTSWAPYIAKTGHACKNIYPVHMWVKVQVTDTALPLKCFTTTVLPHWKKWECRRPLHFLDLFCTARLSGCL